MTFVSISKQLGPFIANWQLLKSEKKYFFFLSVAKRSFIRPLEHIFWIRVNMPEMSARCLKNERCECYVSHFWDVGYQIQLPGKCNQSASKTELQIIAFTSKWTDWFNCWGKNMTHSMFGLTSMSGSVENIVVCAAFVCVHIHLITISANCVNYLHQ